MITIREPIDLSSTYPLDRLGSLEDILFFDIETTGFSGDSSTLYLIGCAYYRDNAWNLIQWFADTAEAEPELLNAFFGFLSGYSILVHFNGDSFDIPYLLKRCRAYGMKYDFSGITSVDIYKKARPYKKLLNLQNTKQKTMENFLGIHRQDTYSGGQLILVYRDYLITKDSYLYHLLILHNADDLKGMPSILPMLFYPDFLESSFLMASQEIRTYPDIFGEVQKELILVCQSPCSIPVGFDTQCAVADISAGGSRLSLRIPLYEGTLKYFYPNYKDYYYLPIEDTAIHKSVGEYVDRSARVKATAQTCYTRREGCFLPMTDRIWEPVFKEEYKSPLYYAQYQEQMFEDSGLLNRYIHQLLASC